MIVSRLVATALAATCLFGSARTNAQEQFPNRLVTVVAPITPGTAIDILARLYADKLSKRFGQQVVVTNRAGAGGMIGAQAVPNAPADGYTVLFANSGHAILGAINKNLTFDPIGDFAGVFLAGEAPGIVVVPPSLGVSNLKEFVELAKSKPGTINYGSAGIGTSTHGRLRALAVAAETPVTNPISIPTAQSQGFDYQYGTWYGMLAPGKTPKPV